METKICIQCLERKCTMLFESGFTYTLGDENRCRKCKHLNKIAYLRIRTSTKRSFGIILNREDIPIDLLTAQVQSIKLYDYVK